jgi:hypothetical protein
MQLTTSSRERGALSDHGDAPAVFAAVTAEVGTVLDTGALRL